MSEITPIAWLVGNDSVGPHALRHTDPKGWKYSAGLMKISDHEAEVARLRAEVEWLRSWLPPMQVLVSAVEEEFCSEETEISEPDESKVSYPEETCPITFGMIREARKAVDYAIGASA